jgi:DNA processing protein
MQPDRLLPWFHLKSVPGIGNLLMKRLIDRFHSPKAVLEADPRALSRTTGVPQRLAERIKRHRMPGAVETELKSIEQSGIEVVTYSDASYPRLLREIADPPPFLYVYGELDPDAGNVAIVGARNATGYGIDASRKLGADLAQLGVTIVSGMALGIDTAAHEGALRAGGRTIAVLGSGLRQVYPAANRKLFHRISESGAVVTEFALNAKPEAHHFPLRNRIISGMSLGVVVVEASTRSGSLITARLANDQNREVFAVPGSIQSFKSTGTHTLIKSGAKLVENARDVIDELMPRLQMVPGEGSAEKRVDPDGPAHLTDQEASVLKRLEVYPVHIDALQERLAMPAPQVSGVLLTLEVKGLVRQLPGKYFARTREGSGG